MSSEDDDNAFNIFLSQQKQKLKSKYIDELEFEELKDSMNKFIKDSDSESSECSSWSDKEYKKFAKTKKSVKSSMIRHTSPVFSTESEFNNSKSFSTENESTNDLSTSNNISNKMPKSIAMNRHINIKCNDEFLVHRMNTLCNIDAKNSSEILPVSDSSNYSNISKFNSFSETKKAKQFKSIKSPINVKKQYVFSSESEGEFNKSKSFSTKSLSANDLNLSDISDSKICTLFSVDEINTKTSKEFLVDEKNKLNDNHSKESLANITQIFKAPIIPKSNILKESNNLSKLNQINFKEKVTFSKDTTNENFLITPVKKKVNLESLVKSVPLKPNFKNVKSKFSRLQSISGSESESDIFSFRDDSGSLSDYSDSQSVESDWFDDQNLTDNVKLLTPKLKIIKTSHLIKSVPVNLKEYKYDFISSLLDNLDDRNRMPESILFRKQFKKKKEELALKIYEIYNEKVFDNQMPKDIDINWNPRLRKTAGKCRCFLKQTKDAIIHSIKIELSQKILTDADRLLRTLVHEMCHGASWIINKISDGHGPIWKAWTMKANNAFPKVPTSTICHNYKIHYKFEYWCLKCNFIIRRHSKSLGDNKICRRCREKFTLFRISEKGEKVLVGESQTCNNFTSFVKENYSKHRRPGVNHASVMKILSKEYKLLNVSHKDDLSNILENMSLVDK